MGIKDVLDVFERLRGVTILGTDEVTRDPTKTERNEHAHAGRDQTAQALGYPI